MDQATLLSNLRATLERDTMEYHRQKRFFISVAELCLHEIGEGLKKNEVWAIKLADKIAHLPS